MNKWVDDASDYRVLSNWIFGIIFAIVLGLIVLRAEAQGCSLYICQDLPAPTYPYRANECPQIDGIDVTGDWTAWKDGKNQLFDSYRQSYRPNEIEGVVVFIQKHKYLPTLVFTGVWWSLSESNDDANIYVFHPSCGVYLVTPTT